VPVRIVGGFLRHGLRCLCRCHYQDVTSRTRDFRNNLSAVVTIILWGIDWLRRVPLLMSDKPPECVGVMECVGVEIKALEFAACI
jgi:hypothetical protein